MKTTMADVFERHCQKLHRLCDDAVTTKREIDVFAVFNRFTLDSIGEIAFGVNIGS